MSPPTFHHIWVSAARGASPLARRAGSAGPRARGFTLLELMAVVVIVGVLATIAVPGAAERFRENRSQRAADEIATMYRNARMRAMGRGSAVLVRWNAALEQFQTFEGIQGGDAVDAACARQPAAQCRLPTTRWTAGGTQNQLLESFAAADLGQHTTTVAVDGADAANLDICFSPMGSAYLSTTGSANAAALTPMTTVPIVRVRRSSSRGLTRQVLFLPNGTARVKAEDPDAGSEPAEEEEAP